MKRLTVLLSLLASSFYGQNYSVTSFSNSYIDLVNPQVLTIGVWDDPDIYIVPGFPVEINGNSYDSLLLSDLGCTVTGVKNGVEIKDAVNPSLIDVIDRGYDAGVSQSNISMIVDGFVGNRILKIQWKNVGSYGDYDMGGNAMSINFQLWFYEQGRFIEVRYGTSNVTDINIFYEGETGAGVVVLDDLFNSNVNDVFLTGSTTFPAVTNQQSAMTGTPNSGQVYKLTPSLSVGVMEMSSNEIKVFPNPCYNVLNVSASNIEKYTIFDINGRIVKSDVLFSQSEINVSDLDIGSYLLSVINFEGEMSYITFIKQ